MSAAGTIITVRNPLAGERNLGKKVYVPTPEELGDLAGAMQLGRDYSCGKVTSAEYKLGRDYYLKQMSALASKIQGMHDNGGKVRMFSDEKRLEIVTKLQAAKKGASSASEAGFNRSRAALIKALENADTMTKYRFGAMPMMYVPYFRNSATGKVSQQSHVYKKLWGGIVAPGGELDAKRISGKMLMAFSPKHLGSIGYLTRGPRVKGAGNNWINRPIRLRESGKDYTSFAFYTLPSGNRKAITYFSKSRVSQMFLIKLGASDMISSVEGVSVKIEKNSLFGQGPKPPGYGYGDFQQRYPNADIQPNERLKVMNTGKGAHYAIVKRAGAVDARMSEARVRMERSIACATGTEGDCAIAKNREASVIAARASAPGASNRIPDF